MCCVNPTWKWLPETATPLHPLQENLRPQGRGFFFCNLSRKLQETRARKPDAGFLGIWPIPLYQGSEMLTHHALEMLNRRTGLTGAR